MTGTEIEKGSCCVRILGAGQHTRQVRRGKRRLWVGSWVVEGVEEAGEEYSPVESYSAMEYRL
jgi:hypothetical protein